MIDGMPTSSEIADILGISSTQVRHWAAHCGMPAGKVKPAGRSKPVWIYCVRDVFDWLRANPAFQRSLSGEAKQLLREVEAYKGKPKLRIEGLRIVGVLTDRQTPPDELTGINDDDLPDTPQVVSARYCQAVSMLEAAIMAEAQPGDSLHLLTCLCWSMDLVELPLRRARMIAGEVGPIDYVAHRDRIIEVMGAPGQWVGNRRINHALTRLISLDLSITQAQETAHAPH